MTNATSYRRVAFGLRSRDTGSRHFHKGRLAVLRSTPFPSTVSLRWLPFALKRRARTRFPIGHSEASAHRHSRRRHRVSGSRERVLGELLRRWKGDACFLKSAIAHVSGLTSPSLRSFFWLGGATMPLHPYLANALLVSVDRRRKRPADSRLWPIWGSLSTSFSSATGPTLAGPCGMVKTALWSCTPTQSI